MSGVNWAGETPGGLIPNFRDPGGLMLTNRREVIGGNSENALYVPLSTLVADKAEVILFSLRLQFISIQFLYISIGISVYMYMHRDCAPLPLLL
jgi:hypothetical protein